MIRPQQRDGKSRRLETNKSEPVQTRRKSFLRRDSKCFDGRARVARRCECQAMEMNEEDGVGCGWTELEAEQPSQEMEVGGSSATSNIEQEQPGISST